MLTTSNNTLVQEVCFYINKEKQSVAFDAFKSPNYTTDSNWSSFNCVLIADTQSQAHVQQDMAFEISEGH